MSSTSPETAENSGRCRVLIVTRNFPPLVGGMERLIHHASLELTQQFDVGLCGPKGCSAFAPTSGPIREIPAKPLSRFLPESLFRGLLLASRWRPRIVFAGNGLTGPVALMIGRLVGAKTVVFVHGLDLVARHLVYRRLFLPAVRQCDLILANSESTRRLAVAAGIADQRIRVLHPGVAIPSKADQPLIERFRARLGIGVRPILLSVGRLTPRKGLAEFVESALPMIVAKVPDALLLVAGGPASDAAVANDGDISARINAAVRGQRLEGHVLRLGRVDDETLDLAFRAASILVFPVIEIPGDVEGFGMVAIEAAAHGVPTVAFRVGGVPDAVSDGVSGILIEPNRYDEFAQACIFVLRGTAKFPKTRQFAARFAWPVFGEKLRRVMTEVATASDRP